MYSLVRGKRDKIVLVRQYRVSIDDYIYEFPAGLVEPGEEFHEAAVREMHEETGLTASPVESRSLLRETVLHHNRPDR